MWDVEGLHCVATLAGHSGAVRALAACADKVFSGSDDTTIKVGPVPRNRLTSGYQEGKSREPCPFVPCAVGRMDQGAQNRPQDCGALPGLIRVRAAVLAAMCASLLYSGCWPGWLRLQGLLTSVLMLQHLTLSSQGIGLRPA